jgi:hypothetical protein
MLGTILKLLRPSYALTALILFGGWQGYSFVKSIPERLPLLPRPAEVRQGTEGQPEPPETDQARSKQTPSSGLVAAIERVHPGLRIVYWVVTYVLLCLASVPVIKWALAHESNIVNGMMVIVYSGIGLMAAFFLTAFQFGWFAAIILVLALLCSAAMIVWFAGELEKMRVEDNLSG